VIGLYKTECINKEGPWTGVDDVELTTSGWVHYYNTHRLHSSIGYVPPIDYGAAYLRNPHSQPNAEEINPRQAQHIS
jgi:putative transposase